jgi:hypothetical protein
LFSERRKNPCKTYFSSLETGAGRGVLFSEMKRNSW